MLRVELEVVVWYWIDEEHKNQRRRTKKKTSVNIKVSLPAACLNQDMFLLNDYNKCQYKLFVMQLTQVGNQVTLLL